MLRLMRERGGVQVVADQVGSPTSADSLAAALWRCALDPALSGVIHWTDGGGGVSWFEFAQAIRDEGVLRGLLPAGVQVGSLSTAEYPTPARRPAYSVLDLVSSGRRLGLSVSPWRVELAKVMESIARG
jgi:dTDP-4-dehydrorhamnose reductase